MPRSRTSSALELLVPLRRDDPEPLHRQLERGLRGAVRTGRLAPTTPLPSSRSLAGQLGVSRGIVVEAYEQLVAECYLDAQPGGVTRVAKLPGAAPRRPQEPEPAPLLVDFRPGRPDLDQFPRQVWLRSVRRVLNEAPSERFGYMDGRGAPELRRALAAYLNRVRGTVADPSDIVIATGFAQALTLLAQVLSGSGARRLAVEDPSNPEYRESIRALGIEIVGVPVDANGIRVDMLEGVDADAVLVTAAHQYPVGGVLPADRRAALITWADHRPNRVIVEDDYDAEFRYDRDPIGTLHGLCPDHVVYAGSASKTLAPGLRLGWLVAPARLVDGLAQAKLAADMGSSALDQLAFADLLEHGELDHHLRRMRPIYRRRRDALLAALAREVPALRPVGASAGLHVLAWLPPDLDEDRIVVGALESGIGISGLGPRRIAPGPGGLIFGYGGIAESAIRDGVRRLAEVIASVGRQSKLDGHSHDASDGTMSA
jgi:GntR family transcriptional regulator / MocR family aminotransferase